MAVKAYLPPLLVLPGLVRAYVLEPRKVVTVQALPPEVGGVVPDSKPPSWIMVLGQVRGVTVGAERARAARVERTRGRCIVMGIGGSSEGS